VVGLVIEDRSATLKGRGSRPRPSTDSEGISVLRKPRGAWTSSSRKRRGSPSPTRPRHLRQLHYRLVAAGANGYQNTQSDYKRLSSLTAEARRDGWFPSLSDRTRGVPSPELR
jgi:hypothetical protein